MSDIIKIILRLFVLDGIYAHSVNRDLILDIFSNQTRINTIYNNLTRTNKTRLLVSFGQSVAGFRE